MLFQPYPGTDLSRRAEAEGWFSSDPDAIRSNYYLESPLRYASQQEKRETENVQKVFALLVDVGHGTRTGAIVCRRDP